jgi:hypothetical protein
MSVGLKAFPSSHVAPSGLLGFEHTPVCVLHVPAMWHESMAAQTTGFAPVQTSD